MLPSLFTAIFVVLISIFVACVYDGVSFAGLRGPINPATVTAASQLQQMNSPSQEGHAEKLTEEYAAANQTCINEAGNVISLERKYAVVLDAGSQGTRVHVYAFLYCGRRVYELEYDHYMQVPGGLSNFVDRPEDIEPSSLGRLMRFALTKIPSDLWSKVPVTLKATAGLRVIPYAKRKILMDQVIAVLSKYPLRLFGSNEEAVSVISGREEAIWAWITTNFLLRNIGFHASENTTTTAIMDLGGVSAQLVFELSQEEKQAMMASGALEPVVLSKPEPVQEHHEELELHLATELAEQGIVYTSTETETQKAEAEAEAEAQAEADEHEIGTPPLYSLKFDGRMYTLFQRSYLGLGLMGARSTVKMNHIVSKAQGIDEVHVHNDTIQAHDFECLPSNYSEVIPLAQIQAQRTATEFPFNMNVNVTGSQNMNAAECAKHVHNVYRQESLSVPTLFGHHLNTNVSSPALESIYLFSYIADRVLPFHPETKKEYTVSEISLLMEQGCGAPEHASSTAHFATIKEFANNPHFCFDMTYINSLLTNGCGLEPTAKVIIAKKIDNVELCWAVGAAISMLDK